MSRVHPVSMPAQHGRGAERDRRHAAIAEILVDDDVPCCSRAVGGAIQHQGFLHTDIGSIAVGSAFIQTGRSGGFGWQWLSRGRDRAKGKSRKTNKGESPKAMTYHFDHPEIRAGTGGDRRQPSSSCSTLTYMFRACPNTAPPSRPIGQRRAGSTSIPPLQSSSSWQCHRRWFLPSVLRFSDRPCCWN